MRTLLLVLSVAIVACGCVSSQPPSPDAPEPLPDGLKIVDYDPDVPAELGTGERLTVTVDYRVASCAKARIFARPYTGGEKTPGFRAHPSPLYARGQGQAVCWFTFDQPAVVDEVRVEMVNEANDEVVASIRHRIKAKWGAAAPSPDGLKIVGYKPDVPAELGTGERLTVTVDYRVASCAQARIFARPYTGGEKTPGYRAHPSPLYARGQGQAVCWFTFDDPAVVDEVRVEMVNEATGEVVESIRHRIKAKWGEAAPSPDGLKIVSFDPKLPAKLPAQGRLNVTVAYRIKSCEKVRIFARPYTKGEKTPDYGAHASPTYTRGTGKTVCWFMFSKAAVVDEVRVQMIDEATDKVVAEVRQPIKAEWANP